MRKFNRLISSVMVLVLVMSMFTEAFAAPPDGKGKPPKDEEPSSVLTLTNPQELPTEMDDGDTFSFTLSADFQGDYEWRGVNVSLDGDPYGVESINQNFTYTAGETGEVTESVEIKFYEIVTSKNGKIRTSLLDTFTFDIAVTYAQENKSPVFNPKVYELIIDEDTSGDVDVKATDGDNDILTYEIFEYDGPGTITNDGSVFTYMPAANQTTDQNFTVQVSDGKGGNDTATVTVMITPVNDLPVVEDLVLNTEKGTVVSGRLVATDVEDVIIGFTIDSSNGPNNGSVVITGMDFTYTPDSGFTGTDDFTVIVTDSEGGQDTGLVTVNVTEVNNPPVVSDLTDSTDEDTPLSGKLNVTDEDINSLTVILDSGPSMGSVEFNGINFTYTPELNKFGLDSFSYTVSDGVNTSSIATVSIDVQSVNDIPVVDDLVLDTEENVAINGTIVATDVEDVITTFSIDTSNVPSYGSVVITGMDFTYTPDSGFTGTDDFTVLVIDNDGGQEVGLVTISVVDGQLIYVALGDSIPEGTYYTNLWNYLFGGTDSYSYIEQMRDVLNITAGNYHDHSVSGLNAIDVYDQIMDPNGVIDDNIIMADVITLAVGANDIMDAAPRSGSGLDKYNIDWAVANAGRASFETYWELIIQEIERLNPNATLIVMTIYNPYHTDEVSYNKVNAYFNSNGSVDIDGDGIGDKGLNHIIKNTTSEMDYRVADVYTAFNDYVNSNPEYNPYEDKDLLTGFYNNFCDPHPNQRGQDIIFEVHLEEYMNTN